MWLIRGAWGRGKADMVSVELTETHNDHRRNRHHGGSAEAGAEQVRHREEAALAENGRHDRGARRGDNWQPHSVRAFLSGLRKRGATIEREERRGGAKAYRIVKSAEGAGKQ